MVKKILFAFLFLGMFVCSLPADEWVELPDEFILVHRKPWIYIETPGEKLYKVFEDYNAYSLYDQNDRLLATAFYACSWSGQGFEIKDSKNKLLASLMIPFLNEGKTDIVFFPNKDPLFSTFIMDISFGNSWYRRPFVLLDPTDLHPVILFNTYLSEGIKNYWNIQIIDRTKFANLDPRILALVVTLMTDFARWN